ncbi:MAG TPA: polyprenyl diphosphate synthase [Spirochaetota bacterium]|nr:polyprenyl diphosphate synthase [Spirochaetota bacterium]HNT11525.1 polyprenyl diphosphate synthase [Spirochaetota bacterium]HNV48932.1 polyprenyl diphosphate synthase [Spirochaetota bacterium]HOS39906.1 polyprenyl diphosphate synthase [Spirochaetota bacterium]HPI22721.1 polyprenyl diphosphate synthase [Spirochaetota bacterium]
MEEIRKLLDPKNIPAHIAIIMDGNGRWAAQHGLSRIEGHRRGADAVEPIVEAALDIGVQAVSLYAFSTENWSRPKTEVMALWRLLDDFFANKLGRIKERGIRIRHSGSLTGLPPSTKRVIRNSVAETSRNRAMVLNMCLNYGGRREIADAVNAWADTRRAGERITEAKLARHLYTAGMPEVDLLIRTSGECRVSNFLLWQIAYAEFMFTDVLWPDFSPRHLYEMILAFQKRERRFGGL